MLNSIRLSLGCSLFLLASCLVQESAWAQVGVRPAGLPASSYPQASAPAVSAWDLPAGTALWGLPPQSPHRVIRSPQILSHEELKQQAHRGKLTPPVATIDRAAVEKVWRQPYAYGYFGTQPQRHWQRHFGWNRSYTQWTLK